MMKYLTSSFLLLLVFALPASAQSPVRGNGNVTAQVRPLDRFSSISIDFVAEVVVKVGQSPGIEIVVDDNILPHIGTRIRGGRLTVTQDRWIQPSQTTLIEITTPILARIETSGYSTVEVQGISGPRFAVDAGVGQVVISGETKRLRLSTKTGTIDASAVKAETAEIEITSWGTVLVDAAVLETRLTDGATLVHSGSPQINGDPGGLTPMDTYQAPERDRPERVTFRLRNNRLRPANLEVQGPPGARFGYGFDLGPRASREETWPIGTRVFQVSRFRGKRLLYSISADDAGRTVDLFRD